MPAASAGLNVGFGTPFQAQIDFLRQKLRLPTQAWDDIQGRAHDRAFVVAGAAKADLLADLHQAVIDRATDGQGLQAFRKDFKAIVAKHGWTGWTGEGTPAGEAWRTRVIYQTNMATSYAAGRYQQMSAPEVLKLHPYWRYIHSDGVLHPRPLHLAWHGLTLLASDPFWQTHFPPCGWGCQCRVTSVTRQEGEASARAGLGEPPADWQAIDPKTGAQVGIDKGFDYAPGASVLRPLQEFIDAKLIKLDAPIGAAMWEVLKPVLAMERQQLWWETLDTWLASPQKGRTAVVGTVDPMKLNWLKQEKDISPQSASIGIQEGLILGTKQARHIAAQDGLLDSDWRRLTEIIEDPEAVYFDTRTGKLVYVASAGDAAGIKLSVAFDYRVAKTERMNMVVSGFRQSSKTIDELVRGGLYEPVP
jgi:hypothetical protein